MSISYDPKKPRFADVNHWHPVTDWRAYADAASAGALGFKVREEGYVDPLFSVHLAGAESKGLVAIGYEYVHDPTASDFLKLFGPKDGRLPVIDFEASDITVSEAEKWINAVHGAFGRWPAFYGRSRWIDLGQPKGTAISKCPYWGPEYGPVLRVPAGVGEVIAWQFAGGVPGDPRPPGAPFTFPGVSGHCDINMLVCSVARLKELAGVAAPKKGLLETMANDKDISDYFDGLKKGSDEPNFEAMGVDDGKNQEFTRGMRNAARGDDLDKGWSDERQQGWKVAQKLGVKGPL